MNNCRRFLRVTLEVELNVIGVGMESHIMCCNCVFKIRGPKTEPCGTEQQMITTDDLLSAYR